ncbi:hypothetical protein MOUN0_K01508 [Monosporozyma unispora]|mgnify:CR=1 FL=1|nr:hypothetical protein C6P44_004158 [Kazachstania unispora]
MYNKISKVAYVKIPSSELSVKLSKLGLLPNWSVKICTQHQSLVRECSFPDFETTWSFLNQVAMRAHLWGHHPTIKTTYNKVNLELTTHDIDGGNISDIDLKLAKRIESYINLYKLQR